MNLTDLFKLLAGKKTYLIAAAGIAYLLWCQHNGTPPSETVLGIFASLGLATLRHGIGSTIASLVPPAPASAPENPPARRNGEAGRIHLPCLLLLGGLSAALVLAAGCTSFRHERFSDAGQPIERTTLSAPWLTKTSLENLKSRTSEKRGTNTYTRSLGLDAAEARTDAEGVAALQSLIGQALLQALKTAAPVPVK